jgi:RNA polymerase sigma factor (sigma-70 family)
VCGWTKLPNVETDPTLSPSVELVGFVANSTGRPTAYKIYDGACLGKRTIWPKKRDFTAFEALKVPQVLLSVVDAHRTEYNHAEAAWTNLSVVGMAEEHTTVAVQRYLDELASVTGDAPAEPLVRALIERSVDRLRLLCSTLLLRSYPRLTKPPLNLQADELLSSVVDRLLRALREVRPTTVRQFFALANRHMRWELNDLARRLDKETPALRIPEPGIASPETSGSQLSPNTVRILEAIEGLPDDDREVFDLVRIQGFTQIEAANVLGVSPKTVQRRLNHSLLQLTAKLSDLKPSLAPPEDS